MITGPTSWPFEPPRDGSGSRPRRADPIEFRCALFARAYAESLAFYGDVLGLPTTESWNRGEDDRGTIFAAGGGFVEILSLPADPPESSAWDYRAPRGVTLVLEVADVDALHRRLLEFGAVVREQPREQSWRHRSLVVEDPDGLVIYAFTTTR